MCDGVLFSGWWVGGKEVRMETVCVCVCGGGVGLFQGVTSSPWATGILQ